MGVNKQQKQAAERVKASQPVAEQPKAETAKGTTATKPAAPATPAQPTKQQTTVVKLVEALLATRKIEVKPEMLVQDGKYVNVVIGGAWPILRVGTAGGISVPALRSYKEGMETWTHADELLAKQAARDAKKTAAPAPPAAKEQGKHVAA